MKYLFSLLVATALLTSCGNSHEKSETIKEAEQVHETLLSLSGEVADMMHHKVDDLQGKIETAVAEGDTLMAEQLQALNGKLDGLHAKFHEWEENMVEIPGHNHTHAPGEECDHDHDHEQNAIMEGLSDAEHLEIQQEQLKQLEELKKEIEAINM
ncbi:MAG: hypothetical protein MK081_01745 [Flavobacteriales bacterium]|nr:hypothetical protein [Flavobacteriales bacterium]